ncbi:MAG: gliding motility-associated C-terminal domain-containing protein, partial [Chitinophagales bacterium]|nr:gliding motility-associated C-terminal domain-containing protein [Chitinophagales bacterium]
GFVRNTSGVYRDTLINSVGCDSFLVLHLTVKDTSNTNIEVTLCAPNSFWFKGKFIDKSGLYIDTLMNSVGCDSIVRLNLAINSYAEDESCPYQDSLILRKCIEPSVNGYLLNIDSFEKALLNNQTFFKPIPKVIISTEKGFLYAVTQPLIPNAKLDLICSDSGKSYTDVAINSKGEIYVSTSNEILKINKKTCSATKIPITNMLNNPIYALSFDFKDNLYIGYGNTSIIQRVQKDSFRAKTWHNFGYGSSGGDIVLLHDTMYNAWRNNKNDFELIRVIVDSNFNYISSGKILDLSVDAFGLASELGELYGVSPQELFHINLNTIPPSTRILMNNSTPYQFYGAAGYHEVVKFISIHNSHKEASLGINPIKDTLILAKNIQDTIFVRLFDPIYDDLKVIPIFISTKEIIRDTLSIAICQGETYNFKGSIISQSGFYTVENLADSFCPSYHSLSIHFHDTMSTQIFQEICRGQEYNGYRVAGIYPKVFKSVFGCDSTVFLNLKVKDTSITIIDTIICQGQSFEGYSKSDIYLDTLFKVNGCDSLRLIDLFVAPTYSTQENKTICANESYLGLSEPGNFQVSLKSQFGCDSLINLNLTVRKLVFTYVDTTICSGIPVFGYATPGKYMDTLISQTSCDTVRTLILRNHKGRTTNLYRSLCQGIPYDFYGNMISKPGVYVHNLSGQDQKGCDSMIVLTMREVPRKEITRNFSSCDSVLFRNRIYVQDTLIIDTILSFDRICDSIYVLNQIKVNSNPEILQRNLSGCERIDFNGISYTRDTSVYQSISSRNNPYCDSIVTRYDITLSQKPKNALLQIFPDTMVQQNEKINLKASGGKDYYWNISNENSPQISYQIERSQWVEVKISNAENCDTTLSQKIQVVFRAPSVITPNNDGENDVFQVDILEGQAQSFEIFNRYGQRIFYSNQASPTWDGTYQGELQPEGTYVYQIQYIFRGKSYQKTGAITIIR